MSISINEIPDNDGQFMIEQVRYPVRCGGQDLSIATRRKNDGADMIVFLHGFGCSGESFSAAFEASALVGFSLCAIDFPSHGSSSPLDHSLTSLQAYADVVSAVVERLAARRLFLVCHSMGGAVGLLVTQGLANLAGFVSIEGNLVDDDCGLVSRDTAGQPLAAFVQRGYGEFLEQLISSGRPDYQAWARWYSQCDAAGLHQISRSLVEWCDSGKLLTLFRGLGNRHYIYGRDSSVDHLVPRLYGIPRYGIQGGHFLMLDNPAEFYPLLGEILSGSRAGNGSAAGSPG